MFIEHRKEINFISAKTKNLKFLDDLCNERYGAYLRIDVKSEDPQEPNLSSEGDINPIYGDSSSIDVKSEGAQEPKQILEGDIILFQLTSFTESDNTHSIFCLKTFSLSKMEKPNGPIFQQMI